MRAEETKNKRSLLLRPEIAKLEKAFVKEALRRSGWNKSHAATLLGVGRAQLYRMGKRSGVF